MVDFVGGQLPQLGSGGDTGNVFITWNGQDATLTGFNTCPTPPITAGRGSRQIANVQYVRDAIDEFAGEGGPSPGAVEEAPINGQYHVRQDGGWVQEIDDGVY